MERIVLSVIPVEIHSGIVESDTAALPVGKARSLQVNRPTNGRRTVVRLRVRERAIYQSHLFVTIRCPIVKEQSTPSNVRGIKIADSLVNGEEINIIALVDVVVETFYMAVFEDESVPPTAAAVVRVLVVVSPAFLYRTNVWVDVES